MASCRDAQKTKGRAMSKTPKHVRGDLTTHIMDKVVQAANDVADLIDIDEEPDGVFSLYTSAMIALLALTMARFHVMHTAPSVAEHMRAVDFFLGDVRERYLQIVKRDLAPLMKAKLKRSADRR